MKKLLVLSLLFLVNHTFAQKHSEESLRMKLDSLAVIYPGYNNNLQLNVSGIQLAELVNSVALENNLNISIEPSLNQVVSYNFFDAQVKDLFVFIYLKFEVEYDFYGSILSIRKRLPKVEEPKPLPVKEIDAKYNPANTFLSLDLKNDTLWKVAEKITKISGVNIVVSPGVRDQKVNAYLLNRPIGNVLELFGESNGLDVQEFENHFSISKGDVKAQQAANAKKPYKPNSKAGDFIVTKNPVGTIDVFARDIELSDVIQAAAEETGVHYVFYSNIQGKTNLDVKDVRFEELTEMLFSGSNYSIDKRNDIYIIGETKSQSLRTSELIRLQNRTIESVRQAIPQEMLQGIEVKEFVELNGLIVTGTIQKINELNSFISSIDLVVPMVQIDVMLLFSQKGSSVQTGIKAGIKDEPTTTQGTIFPELDVEMGSESINLILNAISGFGLVNLGQVTENFYVSLQALESNNVISIESTPKLSTLNGHEATISIGETTYYQERQVNVQTAVTNNGIIQSAQWKSIDANLSVNIKPFVSADEYVTLTITVEQDDFSGKVDPQSPPNITTQTFESVVRVKNGELILLGGLDKKVSNDSGSGVPLLSRIPIIKWLFSSRQKEREKSKLHILIRPTVTY